MWKKLGLLVLVLALITVFIIPPAEAGIKKRLKYLYALGLLPPPPPPIAFYSPVPNPYDHPPQQEYVPGHWETTREWVPESWERVWVPGHYDHWGRWVPGHYENRLNPGYYAERRVWIEGYYRSY